MSNQDSHPSSEQPAKSKGKRSSLSESLIQQFIQDPNSVQPVDKPANTEVNTQILTDNIKVSAETNNERKETVEEPSFAAATIEVFKSSQKEATTRFTVDLPKSKHQKFAIVSKQFEHQHEQFGAGIDRKVFRGSRARTTIVVGKSAFPPPVGSNHKNVVF